MTTRKIPAHNGNRDLPEHRANGYVHPNRVEPSDAEIRAVRDALELLKQLGYGIAMRCVDCHHPITHPVSLERMRGSKCYAKSVAK